MKGKLKLGDTLLQKIEEKYLKRNNERRKEFYEK